MSKVLEFGNQEVALSKSFYPEDEIEVKPLEGEWWWIDKNTYKGIWSFYNFTKTPYSKEQQVIDSWANGLVEDGLLHIVVPSFEYLCRMGLQSYQEPWVKPLLLDATNQFTMPQLRILMNRAGLNVLKAKTGEGRIKLFDNEIVLEQHYLVGQNAST